MDESQLKKRELYASQVTKDEMTVYEFRQTDFGKLYFRTLDKGSKLPKEKAFEMKKSLFKQWGFPMCRLDYAEKLNEIFK